MSDRTFYDNLMKRQAEAFTYKGKLLLKKDKIDWHTSPQGRNGTIVDGTTGLEAKTFGMVITELPPGAVSPDCISTPSRQSATSWKGEDTRSSAKSVSTGRPETPFLCRPTCLIVM